MATPVVTIVEAQGEVPIAAPALDSVALVMGTASSGTANQPRMFKRSDVLRTNHGEGPAVREAAHMLRKTRTPLVFCRVAADTPGAYGVLDDSGVSGTAEPVADVTSIPLNDYEIAISIVSGGTIGAVGITYRSSLDDLRTTSGLLSLGVASEIDVSGSDAKIFFNPPIGALVPLAVELRADLLAHFALLASHNAADAAAIAAIVSGVPTTDEEAIATLNECRTALGLHLLNATAHNSIDLADAVLAPVATTKQSGITLALDLKRATNDHLAVAIAAAPSGLKVATATVASPVVLTTSQLLSAGIESLDDYPRQITFTTGGATPADAPATVTITGFSETGAAQTEAALALSQIAGAVTSTLKWKGTGLTISYPAADGTAATIAIGYTAAVHTAADAANVITTADPSRGTLNAGDVIKVKTTAPSASTTNLQAAFNAIADSDKDFTLIRITGTFSAVDAAAVTSGLDTLLATGRRCTAVISARPQADGETELDWIDSLRTEWAGFFDDRITVCAGTAWVLTDGWTRIHQFNGSFAHALMVRLVQQPRYVSPNYVALGSLPDTAIVNSSGDLIGHDENVNPGLDDPESGARFSVLCRHPEPTIRAGVYLSHWYVQAGTEGRIKTGQVRRVVNAVERVAAANGFQLLGSDVVYDPAANLLGEADASAIEAKLEGPISREFQADISNPNDPDLVVVDRNVGVIGDDIIVPVTVNLAPLKYIGKIEMTINVRL